VVWYVRPLVRDYRIGCGLSMLTRTNVTHKVTLSVTYATPWNCGSCVSECGCIVGDDVAAMLSNENGPLCVMCVIVLSRYMKICILYIYTVVYIVLG
jgi:hypothetical protein